jgi:hypothetical protein
VKDFIKDRRLDKEGFQLSGDIAWVSIPQINELDGVKSQHFLAAADQRSARPSGIKQNQSFHPETGRYVVNPS